MGEPYYADESVQLYHGDALEVLRALPDGSVDCVVTSPPYYGLRDYGVPGQYGLESTPAEYVETMRALFSQIRRALAVDGTVWLNLGDSYARGNGQGNVGGGVAGRRPARRLGDLPSKSLLGIPWRVAFALQDDGWTLRNDIIWHKPNAMPASVTDRLSNRHEHLFLFSRSDRYWFDLDAIREPHTMLQRRRTVHHNYDPPSDQPEHRGLHQVRPDKHADGHPKGRNPGDVWSVSTVPFAEAHFAAMPPELAARCVTAGCRPGGTVLDPFCGSGTSGMVALERGRRFVGIDLSAAYLDLALRTRLRQPALIEEGVDA